MELADIRPDETSLNAVIGAFAKQGDWRQALRYLHRMRSEYGLWSVGFAARG
jgi:pentatricopeptide repeat protein